MGGRKRESVRGYRGEFLYKAGTKKLHTKNGRGPKPVGIKGVGDKSRFLKLIKVIGVILKAEKGKGPRNGNL